MDDRRSIHFGTDGWRGVMCDDFTLPRVDLVAQAIAEYVRSVAGPEPAVIVGHDTRFFAEQFADACARVLTANGIRVLAAGRAMPTPVVAFAIGACRADGAIMLTASHNPPIYNGIKFIPAYGGPASPEITAKIEAALAGLRPEDVRKTSRDAARCESCDPIEDYTARLHGILDVDGLRSARLKVVFDAMYGAGQGIMTDILAGVGCDAVSIHESRDAFFGGVMPEPNEANLAELIGLVAGGDARIGLALDGDADRFGVVDADGALLSSNQVLALLALHLLRRRGMTGRIVRTVATTHLLDAIAAAHGVELVETPVGFKYIAAEMLAGDVLIGGEESGGLSVAGHIPEKDGLLADLLMCEVTSVCGSLSAELDRLYDEFGLRITRRIDVHYPSEAKAALLDRLANAPPAAIGDLSVRDVNTLDGVKYLLDREAWVLIRPSGTEPVVRAYVEAKDEDDFEIVRTWTQKQLKNVPQGSATL